MHLSMTELKLKKTFTYLSFETFSFYMPSIYYFVVSDSISFGKDKTLQVHIHAIIKNKDTLQIQDAVNGLDR